MENVVLIIHLILALALIGVVLLQRSEGGGLLSGGGAMTGRQAATALSKVTWGLAICFIITSLALTIIAAQKSSDSSVLDRIGGTATQSDTKTPTVSGPAPDASGSLLPPSDSGSTDGAAQSDSSSSSDDLTPSAE